MATSLRTRVHSVTNAPRSLRDDRRSREIRYLMSMGIRTLCFVLAFVTTGPLRWTFVVAAFVLPYIAVVFANAGREQKKSTMSEFRPPPPPAIESADVNQDGKHTTGERTRNN